VLQKKEVNKLLFSCRFRRSLRLYTKEQSQLVGHYHLGAVLL